MSNKKFSWNRPFPKWLTALSFVLLSLILVGTGSTVFPQVVEASEAVLPVQQEDDETPDAGEGEEEEIDEFINIVVARVPIAIGTRIEPEFIMLEPRLVTNTAIRGNYTITSFSDVVGRIVKTDLSEGQEILEPMLALSATDLPEIGSDLSLHVDNGQVAIAFPINRYSGMANAMRPGDRIDVLMTFNLIELDVEFQTPLPNITRLVDQEALERGEPFLFPAISQGRQELIPQIGRVVEVIPKGVDVAVGDGTLSVSEPEQIPRRATQLTIQQAEVLWIGNWNDPRQSGWQGPNNYSLLPTIQRINILIEELSDVPSAIEVRESGELELINVRRVQLESLLSELNDLTLQEQEQILVDYGIEAQSLKSQVLIARNRLTQILPDVMIISLPLQDALTLKWAYEESGIDIDFALRSQGDNAVFVTTPVSLPQLVEQAGLTIPEPPQFGLNPYIGTSDIERLPNDNFSAEYRELLGIEEESILPSRAPGSEDE